MATAEPAIVVVAAEQRELAGLVAHATSVTALKWPVRYALEAVIQGRRWLLVAHGAGTTLAAEAARVVLDRSPARGLISTGLCGALDPELLPADIVAATEVAETGPGARRFSTAPVRCAVVAKEGVVACSPRVATTADEKARLRATGAIAVEMEAAGVAEAAARARLPFYCIKGVSDTSEESLPLDFNRYRDADGRFAAGRIAAAALLRPARLPALIQLLRASRVASVRLGDFLANCQF